jgi:beta-glucosidase/6-phospho-beta-glucosidase/beta-galactosidase
MPSPKGCAGWVTWKATTAGSRGTVRTAQWRLMDNFEWNAGLSGNRFGLLYVDFKTQKRTPKLSAPFFRETARRHAVV